MKPAPGHVHQGQLLVQGARLFVGCDVGSVIELVEVQPEGKKRISAKDFIHGYRPRPGESLDS
jgi:methionyl-tRNA formyltransferase